LQTLQYRKAKKNFFNRLNEDIFKKMIYRPYFNEELAGIRDKEYIRKKYPSLPMLESDLLPELLKCNLLVLDHPGTTLNIAFAANVPTIAFWYSEFWPACEEANQYFDMLKKAGILFDNPIDAAEQVNNIGSDVYKWWSQKEIQKVKNAWCQQYALSSKFWWAHWIKALWKL
jgi:putative transferase (TIGR04331 family)